MDDDDKELICHLFAKASELAETAHDARVNGQAANCNFDEFFGHAQQLTKAVIGIQSIAEAIVTITGSDHE